MPDCRRHSFVAVAAACLGAAFPSPAADSDSPGLAVTFSAGGASHTTVLPAVALHVPAGQPATPFVAAGPFTAIWEGSIHAELRGQFTFESEVSGSLRLEINGQTVLDSSGVNRRSPLSQPVRLNKGPNPIKAVFASAPDGDSFVRLGWAEKGTNTTPLPPAVLTHSVSPALAAASPLATGRELFLEHRCIRCHLDDTMPTTEWAPELAMDSPALDGIGSRRHFEWITRWLLDPKAIRPTARMPALLHGPAAADDARAMAAYLASQKDQGPAPETREPGASTRNAAENHAPPRRAAFQSRQGSPSVGDPGAPAPDGRRLYERLRCGACHNPPDAPAIDPAKLSQKDAGTKFPRGRLAEFLLAPDAGYAWTRMPNFHLSTDEALALEGYLLGAADSPKNDPAPTDGALLEKGRQLVQTRGCLNCHALKLENRFKAPPLAGLAARPGKTPSQRPAGQCLGGSPRADFKFSPAQKEALERFLAGGLPGLRSHVPAEFATRQTRLLNCMACHGQIDLIPPLDVLGGKLKPEWNARFMAGEIPRKMRFDNHPKGEVWVEARMPAFPSRATDLARGLAALHGFPGTTPAEDPVNAALAEIGRTLVGKDGGFSCVSCHAVGSVPALEVFESEGINLALSADRLLPSYYRRWLRNPLGIDPQTKMPAYLDEEGASPLTDILGGNGEAQIDAIWHYLRLRDKMPPPKTGLE